MLNPAPLNQGQHVIASSLHRLRGTDNLRFNNEKMGYLSRILLGIWLGILLGIMLGILLGPNRINVDLKNILKFSRNRIKVNYIRAGI